MKMQFCILAQQLKTRCRIAADSRIANSEGRDELI